MYVKATSCTALDMTLDVFEELKIILWASVISIFYGLGVIAPCLTPILESQVFLSGLPSLSFHFQAHFPQGVKAKNEIRQPVKKELLGSGEEVLLGNNKSN